MTCSIHHGSTDLLAQTLCCGGRARSCSPAPVGCCATVSLAAQLLNAVVEPYACEPAADEDADDSEAPRRIAGSGPVSIVEACLAAFSELGDPEAMASHDLVALLQQMPGAAVGRWRFADLTHARLAHLLVPYDVTTRDATLPDGRRRKSYRLSALLAAEAGAHR